MQMIISDLIDKEYNKYDQMTSDEATRNIFVEYIAGKMRKADWYHAYSDGSDVYWKGKIEVAAIVEDLRILARIDKGVDEAQKLWQTHVPPYSVASPAFLDNPTYLQEGYTKVFDRKELEQVSLLLDESRKNGERFMAIDNSTEKTGLNKILFFKDALDARNYEYENCGINRPIKVFSIREYKDEISKELTMDENKFLMIAKNRMEGVESEKHQRNGQERSR